MVKLRSGGTADLHTDKLDLESLELLLDLPPDAAVGVVAKIQPLAPILEEPEEEPAEPKDPEQLKQQLERERSSSRKLKRILEDVLSEREDLKEQVIEGRRALESEVWRGMARNKELTSKLRKLEEQLGSDDDEGEGR